MLYLGPLSEPSLCGPSALWLLCNNIKNLKPAHVSFIMIGEYLLL